VKIRPVPLKRSVRAQVAGYGPVTIHTASLQDTIETGRPALHIRKPSELLILGSFLICEGSKVDLAKTMSTKNPAVASALATVSLSQEHWHPHHHASGQFVP